MKKQIPNIFTLLNLLSGLIALIYVFQDKLEYTAYFVFLGIFFDFFDGFFARLLKVQSELGLQLDSLADMITSGVVPGMVLYKLLENFNTNTLYLPFFGLIITLSAGYRLAKFNIDTRQHESFIGVPTPAMSIFVVSLPLIIQYSQSQWIITLIQSKVFLLSVVILFSYLMNSNLPLIALKFKSFDWEKNKIKYILIAISLLLLLFYKTIAIPMIILFYIVLSAGATVFEKNN